MLKRFVGYNLIIFLYSNDKDNDIYINDLEKAAFLVDNSLNILKQNLTKYGKVIMSGTGSSFLVHTDKTEQIKKEYPNTDVHLNYVSPFYSPKILTSVIES